MATTSPAGPAVEDELAEELRGGTLPRWAPGVVILTAAGVAYLLNVFTAVSGVAGTTLVAALLYLVGQSAWSFGVEGRRHAVDRLATTLIYTCFVLAIIPLAWILWSVIANGLPYMTAEFLTHSMRNVNTQNAGGGAYHALVGTIEQVLIAAVMGVPIGILVAIYLVEYGRGNRLAKTISFFVDVMTGVPSIVAGLFIYTLWILALGQQRSGFAGSLALTILMIPIVVRSTEEMLRLVSNDLRESSYALGVPQYKTILRIVLPTAIGGIVTGAMLAVARVTGETAPLLLTTFLSQSINVNPLSGPQASLPTFMWDQIQNGNTASLDRAWAGALLLILFVIFLNVVARLVSRLSQVK